MSDNLPGLPESASAKGWDGFAGDPRMSQNSTFRASDADRHHAFELLADAYSDGRLTHEEYETRLDAAMAARTLGDFPVLVADLLVPAHRRQFMLPAPQDSGASEAHRTRRGIWTGWIVMAVFFNLIWIATMVGSGSWVYWWPFWPMMGTAIPAVMSTLATRRTSRPHPQPLYPPGHVPPQLVPPPLLGSGQAPPPLGPPTGRQRAVRKYPPQGPGNPSDPGRDPYRRPQDR